jgi:hypothetical protein
VYTFQVLVETCFAVERHAQASKLLQEVSLSAQLEWKPLNIEMVKAIGKRTKFTPMNMHIGEIGISSGRMYWVSSIIQRSCNTVIQCFSFRLTYKC